MLIEREDGMVILCRDNRNYYRDDLLRDGSRAGDVEGLDPVLREKWLSQKRAMSAGRQWNPQQAVTLGVRVPTEIKAELQKWADEAGMTLCAFVGLKLIEAVGHEPTK